MSKPSVKAGITNRLRQIGILIAAAFIALLLALPDSTYAGDEQSLALLKARIERHTQGGLQIDRIEPSPVAGLYQVFADNEVFYSDASGRYSFVGGSLMDLLTREDLTARLQDQLMSIPFERLPLEHAIKQVRGNGRQVMALFEDPNCPICRVFTRFVDQIDDVTVYRFMYPVIDQSQALARMAWCAPDRADTWLSIMDGARPNLTQACDISGLETILRLGERYRIHNTPTVVLANGKRLVGATPPEEFMHELSLSSQRTLK